MTIRFCVLTLCGLTGVGMGLPLWSNPVSSHAGSLPALSATRNYPIQMAQDVRESVASIDPTQPIQIRVVSQTDTPVIATLVEPAVGDRPIPPRQSVTFGRLHTSYLPLPIDMTAYVEVPETRLYIAVTTSGNEIIINVTTASTTNDTHTESLGNPTQSMYVDENGLIYVY